MFLQDATPDTSGYMIAGYVITFVIMGLYVASIYLRSRSLKQDQSLLEEMDVPTPAPVEKKIAKKSATAARPKAVTKKVEKQ
jgi:hypothetical protein